MAYATDPDLAPPPVTWSDDVQEGLRFLIDCADTGSYDRNELRSLQHRMGIQGRRLNFFTLLKLAEMQMLEPKQC